MRRWMAALATAAALAAPGAVALADGHLMSLGVGDAPSGWSAVGRLDFRGGAGFCTASLLTDRIALTAAHCVIDPGTGHRIPDRDLTFRIGQRHGAPDATRSIRRIAVHPGYDPRTRRMDRVRSDLALVELAGPVRLADVRPYRVRAATPDGTVAVVSYARHRAHAPQHLGSCAVLDGDDDVLVLDCPMDFGASGAPVFAKVGEEMRIVSVISARGRLRGRSIALATLVEGDLQGMLDALGPG